MHNEQRPIILQRARRRDSLCTALIGLALTTGCTLLPDVDVNLRSEMVTSERGRTVHLGFALQEPPAAPVELVATVSNASEAITSTPIRFDLRDWNREKTIAVTGLDDNLHDGDVTYRVEVHARSTRSSKEPARFVIGLELVNRDDERGLLDLLGDLPGGTFMSQATGLSADGSVVVGWSRVEGADEALRWTDREGLVGLGGPDSRAQAVSPNGQLIAGSIADPSYELGRAAVLWRGPHRYEQLAPTPGPVGAPPWMFFVNALVAHDDGTLFGTCVQYAAYGQPLACRFQPPSQIDILPFSHVYAANEAGDYSGTAISGHHQPFGAHAVFDQVVLPYPADTSCSPLAGCSAAARDFLLRDDGSAVVVGTSMIPDPNVLPTQDQELFEVAFVYTAAEGVIRLPDLPGGEVASGAYAVAADGSLIAGFATDAGGKQAVLWIDGAPVALEDLLVDAGTTMPEGFQLEELRALTDDGRVAVGYGRNAQGFTEGFRVVLPVQ